MGGRGSSAGAAVDADTALVCLSDDRLDRGDGIALDLLERAEAAEERGQRWIPVCNRASRTACSTARSRCSRSSARRSHVANRDFSFYNWVAINDSAVDARVGK